MGRLSFLSEASRSLIGGTCVGQRLRIEANYPGTGADWILMDACGFERRKPESTSYDLVALHPDVVDQANFDTPIMHPPGVTCILTGLGHAAHISKRNRPSANPHSSGEADAC